MALVVALVLATALCVLRRSHDERVVAMSAQGVILMAVHRPQKTLVQRQVASLQRQTIRDWACIVGIDGPDDGSTAYLSGVLGDDPRFKVIEYAHNVGHYRNFERLTREVRGQVAWVAYCDQDDYWHPQKLERLVAMLEGPPHRTAVVGAALTVDIGGAVLGISQRYAGSFPQLFLKNEVTGSFTLFRPEVLELALPFPDATRSAVHDHWLGVCAAAMGDVLYSSGPLQDYVQHGNNAIGEAQPSTFRSHIRSARVRGVSLRAYLDEISRDQWGWRVSMARALRERLPADKTQPSMFLDAVAEGRLSVRLAQFFAAEVLARRIPPRTALALATAAFWSPRARP